eukprot:4548351-Amphidinium_carterae.1
MQAQQPVAPPTGDGPQEVPPPPAAQQAQQQALAAAAEAQHAALAMAQASEVPVEHPTGTQEVSFMDIQMHEVPIELEGDAVEDSKPAMQESITFNTSATSMSILPSTHGNVLMAFSDGGVQYLMGGARSNTGFIGGRYMFEVVILELLTPPEAAGVRPRAPHPRHALRIGFSTSTSPLILGESEDHLCFDSEGVFMCEGKQAMDPVRKFQRDAVLTLVLNLEENIPNAKTVSLFRDGERVSFPLPIPERFWDKPLFPHVSFRNLSLTVNFGPVVKMRLPFNCKMMQQAAQEHVVVTPNDKPASSDGRYDVVFPVGLPDEGVFDWVNKFLEAHPDHLELSDRAVIDWALLSGCYRSFGPQGCNDKQ